MSIIRKYVNITNATIGHIDSKILFTQLKKKQDIGNRKRRIDKRSDRASSIDSANFSDNIWGLPRLFHKCANSFYTEYTRIYIFI